MVYPLVIACTLVVLQIPGYSAKTDEPTRECGGNHVCTTLMRYKDGTIVDEGNNCMCRGGPCPSEWGDKDEHTLTWQHYERAHWTVQYKFCTPVFQGKNLCRPDEMAVVVETDVTTWQPLVSSPRCTCPDGAMVKLLGWKREGALWKYYHSCDKPECALPSETMTESSVCAKIYIDTNKPSDKVNEVEFVCNCPDGFLCPAKFDDKEDSRHIWSDDKGNHVIKLCEPVVKRKKRSASK